MHPVVIRFSASLFIFISLSAITIHQSVAEQSAAAAVKIPPPRIPGYEKVTYKVKWLGAPVGTITVSINGMKKIDGRDAYHIEIIAKTNEFCSKIYRIDDRYVSYIDAKELYTLRHEVYRREGRYKKDAVTDFDQVNHKAHFRNFLDKSEKNFDIPPAVQDPVSTYYYFRNLPMEIGKGVTCWVCNNESNYRMFAVVEKKELINVPGMGRREGLLIQPYARLDGKVVRKGKAAGYFSCDEKRLPLLGILRGPIFTTIVAYADKVE